MTENMKNGDRARRINGEEEGNTRVIQIRSSMVRRKGGARNFGILARSPIKFSREAKNSPIYIKYKNLELDKSDSKLYPPKF